MLPHPVLPLRRISELARDVVFLADVRAVYADLDRRVAARNPVCTNRGLCCKFTQYDHGLFVTPVELAYFVSLVDARAADGTAETNIADPGSCPHHVGGICTTRTARPTGCRIFFCDPAAQGWQPEEYEETLAKLKLLHSCFNVVYCYCEWLEALRQWDEFSVEDAGSG